MIYIVDALFSVDEFEERFGINIKIDETKNYNTISGYIIDILGVIPDNSYIGKEIETEKKQAQADMKQEIVDVAIEVATKVMNKEMNEEINKGLVEEFVN